MKVRATLYSDFNCPFCYALHERLDRLQCWEHVQWKGVQHASFLSVPMTRWSGGDLSELRDEVAFVQRLAPEIPIAVPSGKPNTKLAIAVVAGVMATYPEQAHRLIQSLLPRPMEGWSGPVQFRGDRRPHRQDRLSGAATIARRRRDDTTA
jgi:predicted DsbA family dithiol-disulfide isomerase